MKTIVKLLFFGICAAALAMALLVAAPSDPPDREERDAQTGENMPFENLDELEKFLGGAVALPDFAEELSSFSAYLYFGGDWEKENISSLSAHYFFTDGSICDLTLYPGRSDVFEIPLGGEYFRLNGLDLCCVEGTDARTLYFEVNGDAYRLVLRGANEPRERLLAVIEGFGAQEN